MKSIIAFFTAVIAFFCSIFGLPYYAAGDELDMSKFVLTFSDEFDTFDESVWSGHYQHGSKTAVRKGGYWNKGLIEIRDGALVIPCVYLSEGMGGQGAGWYSAGIDTDSDAPNGFSQRYGYFECRCILPEGADIWSAFWLTCDTVTNEDGSGMDGTEIDVFESDCYGKKKPNQVSSNLHYDGYGDAHKVMGAKYFLVKGDPYSEFNTYGVEWNEDEYIFYINGVETFRTSFGGVSRVEEYMLLSLEVKGENGVAKNRTEDALSAEFIVDYVRAYQYKDLAA